MNLGSSGFLLVFFFSFYMRYLCVYLLCLTTSLYYCFILIDQYNFVYHIVGHSVLRA